MRNRCPICGKPSANSAHQLCMNCQSKYTVEKDGRDYIENPCPSVESIVVSGTHGGHRHVWLGSHEVIDIYWKQEVGKTFISFTPVLAGGEYGEPLTLIVEK